MALARVGKDLANLQTQALGQLRTAVLRATRAVQHEPAGAEPAALRVRTSHAALAQAEADLAAAAGRRVSAT